MDKITRSALSNELARFDSVLTGIDPSLEVDAFNKFMMHPDFQKEILPPPIKVKKTDGSVSRKLSG